MSSAEWWILDSVATFQFPLDALATQDGVAFTLNRKWHGLTEDELVDTLYRLFHDGDLIAERFEKHASLGEFVPTRTEIMSALSFVPPNRRTKGYDPASAFEAYYGLTAQGGARWEAVFRPDWNRYVYSDVGLDDGQTIAMDRCLVEQYEYFSRYGSDISIIAGSEQWDVLEPWQATYWKTLPIGHRLRYRFTCEEASKMKEIPDAAEQFFKGINNWYTRYSD